VKAGTHARRCYAAGFIPSLRQQEEFASGFDRYIEERRTLLAPEDVEICSEMAKLPEANKRSFAPGVSGTRCVTPVVSSFSEIGNLAESAKTGAQCSDCQEDTR
jgi:hypothetical protein